MALWQARAKNRELDREYFSNEQLGGEDLSIEQQENLEANGYVFALAGRGVPARMFNGLGISVIVRKLLAGQLSAAQWGIVRTIGGELVVPDRPTKYLIPIQPGLCFYSPSTDGLMSEANLALLNRVAVAGSENYYFARDLTACPGVQATSTVVETTCM